MAKRIKVTRKTADGKNTFRQAATMWCCDCGEMIANCTEKKMKTHKCKKQCKKHCEHTYTTSYWVREADHDVELKWCHECGAIKLNMIPWKYPFSIERQR